MSLNGTDSSLKVYELAKELQLDSRRLIDLLRRLHVDVTNHMSSVPPQAIQVVREIMQGKLPSSGTALENFPDGNRHDEKTLDRPVSENLQTLSQAKEILKPSQKTIPRFRSKQPSVKRSSLPSIRQTMQEVKRCLDGKGRSVDASTWMRWYESARTVCNKWALLESTGRTSSYVPTWLANSPVFAIYKNSKHFAKALIRVLDNAAPPSEGRGVDDRPIPNLLVAQTLKIDVSKTSVHDAWARAVLQYYRMHYLNEDKSLSHRTPEGRQPRTLFPDWRLAIMDYPPAQLQPEEKVRLNIMYQKCLGALEHSSHTPPLEGWKSPVEYRYLAHLGWRTYQVTAEYHAWGRFHIWTDHGELDFALSEYIEPGNDNELIVLTWAFSVLEGLRCEHTKFTPDGYRPRKSLALHKSGTHSPKAHRRFITSIHSIRRHASEPQYMKARLSRPTLVRGHSVDLKGRGQPKPPALELARLYRVHVAPGHTFRRPHPRGISQKEELQWHISWDTHAVIHELPNIAQVKNNPG